MRACVLAAIPVLALAAWLAPAATAQDEWKTATFPASLDSVYHAAEIAVAKKHEVKSKDPELHIIRFHVGTTSWSWGYNMSMAIEDAGNGMTRASVEVEKSGGPAFSWGSGKKEVHKIFDQMRNELLSVPAEKRK
jgi:hypothetical protein